MVAKMITTLLVALAVTTTALEVPIARRTQRQEQQPFGLPPLSGAQAVDLADVFMGTCMRPWSSAMRATSAGPASPVPLWSVNRLLPCNNTFCQFGLCQFDALSASELSVCVINVH